MQAQAGSSPYAILKAQTTKKAINESTIGETASQSSQKILQDPGSASKRSCFIRLVIHLSVMQNAPKRIAVFGR